MDICGIIEKKRDNNKLTQDEIEFFVDGFSKGEIPNYQASALLMAMFIRGLDEEETFQLMNAMKNSGAIMDLSAIDGIKVDKHSTGGVGDKTTMIVTPLAAANGVPIAKMSGRGLGFTGGTVDKLESIPGFCTALSMEEFVNSVNSNGIAVIGQTQEVAIADKKLYALRDVTATVDNTSLIASSIMSKKLASGSDAIVLDVKCGAGAFSKTEERARALAEMMVKMGKAAGKRTVALITSMEQPLGNAVGNSLEVIEAIEVLKGNGPKDITELSIFLAGLMIYVGGKAESIEAGKKLAEEAIANGSGLEKFKEFVSGQNGDSNVVEDYSLFPQPKYSRDVCADSAGLIKTIKADTIGYAAGHLGAGRQSIDDVPNLAAGIVLKKKIGDVVANGDVIATLYSDDLEKMEFAEKELVSAYTISDSADQPKLIIDIVQ